MTSKTRFARSVAKTAAETATVMPWARGSRRAAFIAKRRAAKARSNGKAA